MDDTEEEEEVSKLSLALATILGMLATLVPITSALAVGEELVINEVDYDQDGTDSAEFVEIYNTGEEAVALDGLQVELVNGSNGSVYDTISLSGSLAAGDFLVVCANAGTTPNCDVDDGPDTNFIQNGAPDAIALTRSADGVILDALSYEGTVTGYSEGTGTSAADNSAPFLGLSRRPDGADTNDNSADFSLTCITPGTSNGSESTDCPDPAGPPPPPPPPLELEIYEVQGSGSASPYDGQPVTIDGIVVGDFQGNAFAGNQLGGFHLQEAEGDDDAATSDGIFVFDPDAPEVEVGDLVEVTGTVDEFNGLTEITDVTDITVTPDAGSVEPTAVALPVSSQSDWEPFEGMLVTFEQDLYISEFFNFDRFNEIVVTTERQYQGTQVAEPGPAAVAVAEANALARITLDDGRTSQNPDPAIHPDGTEFTLDNTFRGGDILQEVTGVMDFSFGLYRIQPTEGATHVEDNPRPLAPEPIGGDLRVATFNVLNFFTHLDDGVNDICGPTGDMECRGADTQQELDRQLAKLVAGIVALDADIVGIQEIENDIYPEEIDGNRAHDAVRTLVEALNAEEGPGTWAWAGEANHYNDYPVRNDIIYRRRAVVAKGSPVALEHTAFDRTRPEAADEPVGRPPLAQTFLVPSDMGRPEVVTVVVNHFKSKGSSCASIGDPELPNGQGNCNMIRLAQANALLEFAGELQEDSGDPDVLLIGDLNSYAMEDPIKALEGGGFTDLVRREAGTPRVYTYLFDGQLGTLDYIMANETLLDQVEGVTVFHINADEADILDYDTSFKRPAQDALYESKPYRVSDHDPVIVGLSLASDGVPGRGSGRGG